MASRRDFLQHLVRCGVSFASLPAALAAVGMISDEACAEIVAPQEVKFYQKLAGNKTQCHVCPLDCILNPGETCFCRTRNNRGGVLYTYAFNNPTILKLDPIEKLPLNHFLPGTRTLSLATGGCNLRCLYCQNWEQSQARPEVLKTFTIDRQKALQFAHAKDVRTIAYTYTEPVVFSEYIVNLAEYTRPQGINHVAATALFIKEEPLKELCKYLSAFSIALKGFREEFYKSVCGQSLKPVLQAIEIVQKTGVWFELVTLLIPTYNDSTKELKDLCQWVYRNLGPLVPIHFSRFVPEYKLRNLPKTPVKTLEEAREIALSSGIKYAYTSNIAPHLGGNTYCHSCKKLLMERLGFQLLKTDVKQGKCPHCGEKIPGVWKV